MNTAPRSGLVYASLAALLFGLSTPFAKLLLGTQPPILLAGILYLGSGIGLSLVHIALRARGTSIAPMPKGKWPWLVGAIVCGGVIAPVLLMTGLLKTSGATASLLLNLEGVFTALLAWTLGKENADRRIILGMTVILIGGALLSWDGRAPGGAALSLGAIAIAAACVAWAVDNNLTQAVSSADPVLLAALKGLVAGVVNLTIAFMLGAHVPSLPVVISGLVVGFAGYGVSLVCFILALRHVGTARTGAYFATGPFIGAAASFALLDDEPTLRFGVAALLMGVGVWIHVTEKHRHEHTHEPMTHSHRHTHDEHHQHAHGADAPAGEPHVHEHTHAPLVHSHVHAPDIHHRHSH